MSRWQRSDDLRLYWLCEIPLFQNIKRLEWNQGTHELKLAEGGLCSVFRPPDAGT